MKKKSIVKPYVKYKTIWNAVGGGLSNSGESRLCKVGKHKVLLSRSIYVDRYGNPIHTASVINKDGRVVSSYRSNGSATLTVSRALKKSGVDTKK